MRDDEIDAEFEELIRFMDGHYRDFESNAGNEFMKGFRYARYLVREFHLMQNYDCECDQPTLAEKRQEGWTCIECEMVVFEEGLVND